jgi:Holin of 3TMs, for gene-transfer release
MANDDVASGHNVKGDDEWVPNPNKVKPKPKTDTPAAPTAPSYTAPIPPTASTPVTPEPGPVTPPPPVQETVVVVAPQPPQQQYNPQQTAQFQAQVASSQTESSIDNKIVDEQTSKENEHWVKAYWRPAMGWLYMVICFMDFVGFPLLTIFLPIIFKPFGLTMPYTAWQSLTLSNGGLIHLSFGAILGVSAFSRGQEKKLGV